jgi:hypothetical protein
MAKHVMHLISVGASYQDNARSLVEPMSFKVLQNSVGS